MQFQLQDLKDMTRCLAVSGILAVTLGCGQVKNENEEPARPTEATQLQAPTTPAQSEQDLSTLQAYLDGHDGLLPATYSVQDVFISHLVSQIDDGSFSFDLARATDSRFAMEAFSLSHKVGGSYAEVFTKEFEVWQSHGFLKCRAQVTLNEKPRAVLATDGRPAVKISVNVILTDVTDAVPSLSASAYSRTLGYLLRSAHTEDKPLKYDATIVVEQKGGRFVVASHGREGQELNQEALQAIVRRNVMTLLSAEVVGFMKRAATMALSGGDQRISLERLRGFDRDRKQAEETAERDRIHTEEIRVAEQTRAALQSVTKSLVDAIPSRAAGVQVHVALTREVRDQLRHNALDIELFDAVAHSWELQAAAVRSRPGYSAKQLAKDAAAMIQEFGVATVTCDLEIGRPSFRDSARTLRFPVTYRVVSIDAKRPRETSSWIAGAAWAALPKQGGVTLEFPVDSKGESSWRIGYTLPVGGLLGRVGPETAWGQPVDVLSPQSVLNAANRAVAESLAVDCERAAKEAIELSPADRIQKSSFLFGGIDCLPEAAPKEDGIDLALLSRIADEVDSGVYWEKRLPGVAAADRDVLAAVFKRLSAVLKPKKWTSKLNERIVASPVFLSNTEVMFDLGVDQRRIGVTRDACNEEGWRLLDRIEKIAIECVVKLNEAARSRDGVQSDKVDAAWHAVSEAARFLVAGNRGEGQKLIPRLAVVYASLESNSATEVVRGNIAKCAAAAVEVSSNHGGGDVNSRLLQPFLVDASNASGIRPGVVARVKMLLALNDFAHCREVAEKAIVGDPGSSQRSDYGRIAWALGSAQMADGKTAQAVEWLQKAIDAFAESRGKVAMPPAALLQELGAAMVAAGQSQKGEQALKECRRVLLLTYGEDDSRVKQLDATYATSEPVSTE